MTRKDSYCGHCDSPFPPELLFFVKGAGKWLCPTCRHSFSIKKDEKLLDSGGVPKILRRRLAEDMRTVVELGKDVPPGYQDDPHVIEKKLEAQRIMREKQVAEKTGRSKEWWGKFRALLRRKGVEYLKEQGWSEGDIRGFQKMVERLKREGGV